MRQKNIKVTIEFDDGKIANKRITIDMSTGWAYQIESNLFYPLEMKIAMDINNLRI